MENRTKILLFGFMYLLLMNSCCNEKDRVYWFPDEAVRYYNEHDTVKFYCAESDVFESYIVCNRDTSQSIEQYYYNSHCEYTEYSYSLRYILYLDSCGSSQMIIVGIDNARPGNIDVSITTPDIDRVGNAVLFDESRKFSIDVLGYTYHDVIEISSSGSSEIPSFLFSYEYGVIQIQFENKTFSLANNEN